MNTQIDTSTTEGKAAVMLAASKGADIEFQNRNLMGCWILQPTPSWDWFQYDYRIKEEKFPDPPEGEEWHNPGNLTLEQVGMKDGWRLAFKSELNGKLATGCAPRELPIGTVEMWCSNAEWDEGQNGLEGTIKDMTYRTKLPLPAKPKLIPWEAKDVPPICFVRSRTNSHKDMSALVIGIDPEGCEFLRDQRRLVELVEWRELFNYWEYSTDRITWKPCSKESK